MKKISSAKYDRLSRKGETYMKFKTINRFHGLELESDTYCMVYVWHKDHVYYKELDYSGQIICVRASLESLPYNHFNGCISVRDMRNYMYVATCKTRLQVSESLHDPYKVGRKK